MAQVGTDAHPPGMDRRLLPILALLVTLLLGAAPARAADATAPPPARWPVGGSTLRLAMALGAEHWGMAPCGGRVALRWTRLDPLNAQASWANDRDPYLQPSFNSECEIALSTGVDWDWLKLCTVVVHEVGHLTGHQHSDDPHDVMYGDYVEPTPECEATPEPVETGPPALPPRPAAASRAAPAAAARRAARKPAARKQRRAPARSRRHRR